MLRILSPLKSRCLRSFNNLLQPATIIAIPAIAQIHHDRFSYDYERSKTHKSPLPNNGATNGEREKTKYLLSAVRYDPEARRDPRTWNKLYEHLKLLHGEGAIDIIWVMFADYPVSEVPVVYSLDMWRDLSGRQLIDHIHRLDEAGISPPAGTLKKIGLEWHNLSVLRLTDAERLEAALDHIEVEVPKNVYNELMPKLCERGNAAIALAWHRKLVANGDPPRDFSEVKALRQSLIDRRQWAAALEVKRDVTPFRSAREDETEIITSLVCPKEDRRQALQSFVSELDRKLGTRHTLTSLDDHTCARLFATKFFSVDFIIEGLALFKVGGVGPLSMRELIKRSIRGQTCDSELVRHHLRRLNDLGITTESKYGRLLEHLAESEKNAILYSIVMSEDHPDLFDDIAYQEQLLKNSDRLLVERTREVLLFEAKDNGIEARNILLRAGQEDLEAMIADGVPITRKSRQAMLHSTYISRPPWISEAKLRTVARIFSRLPRVPVPEMRRLIRLFLYVIRPHLRMDLEALLLSIKSSEVFDFRTNAGIIRWYIRLGALTGTPEMTTMLGGVKVLASLRDQGLVSDIRRACEVNLVSLFDETPIVETIDRKKRVSARSIADFEDFVIMIRQIYDQDMWHGMSPTQVKKRALAVAEKLRATKQKRGIASTHQRLSSHTGAYNFGKVWHAENTMSENESVSGNSFDVDLELEPASRAN